MLLLGVFLSLMIETNNMPSSNSIDLPVIKLPIIDAVVFFNESNWAVWISGEEYQSSSEIDEKYCLKEVNQNCIMFTDKKGKEYKVPFKKY